MLLLHLFTLNVFLCKVLLELLQLSLEALDHILITIVVMEVFILRSISLLLNLSLANSLISASAFSILVQGLIKLLSLGLSVALFMVRELCILLSLLLLKLILTLLVKVVETIVGGLSCTLSCQLLFDNTARAFINLWRHHRHLLLGSGLLRVRNLFLNTFLEESLVIKELI